MDKAQKLIQGTSSALQAAVVNPRLPGFAAAGLATENIQPLAAAVFSKAAEVVKSSAEEVGPSTYSPLTSTDTFLNRLGSTPPTTHT
jgi:hypothetical protein